MFDPGKKLRTFLRCDTRGLMREIGSDIPVREDDVPCVEGSLQFLLGFETIAGIEQGREVSIDGIERTKFAVQETADHAAKPGVVLRKAGRIDGIAAAGEGFGQQIDLRAL